MTHRCGDHLVFDRAGTGYCATCVVAVIPGSGDDAWQARANCRGLDPDLFFPTRGESTTEARAVCQGCDVREQCLQYALDNREPHGLWGGLNVRERRKIQATRPRVFACRECASRFIVVPDGRSNVANSRYCSHECRLRARKAAIARSAARRNGTAA